jgi:DNA-binding transcriptional MerR regulator
MMAKPPFTLAQLADAVGMPIADVETYLDYGLLAPPRRFGRRDQPAFHKEHEQRLIVIRRSLEFGFLLEDIGRIVDQSILLTCRDMYELAGLCLDRLREQNGKSDAQERLSALREKCPMIGGRQDCPILAALHDGVERHNARKRRRPSSVVVLPVIKEKAG